MRYWWKQPESCEFVPVTKFPKENEVLEKMKSRSTLSKAFRNFKKITAWGLSSVFQSSTKSGIIKTVCVIVLFSDRSY